MLAINADNHLHLQSKTVEQNQADCSRKTSTCDLSNNPKYSSKASEKNQWTSRTQTWVRWCNPAMVTLALLVLLHHQLLISCSHLKALPVAAQDVALLDSLEAPIEFANQTNRQNLRPAPQQQSFREAEKKMKRLDEFLEGLPTLSLGQKHNAKFECELNKELDSFKLIWLRLRRANVTTRGDDIMLISLNQKIITPDKRFKVRRQSALKWILTIDKVSVDDSGAYYLCQASAGDALKQNKEQSKLSESSSSSHIETHFVGGGRLNVLVPPRIVELDTSGSLVKANEFEQLILRCKVVSEPQSQLMWKREDGKSIEGLEQQYKHEIERKASEILSIDSSELIFNSIVRQQAGAYLCIASNGVQPGVSQRMNVMVTNCRQFGASDSPTIMEPCELPTDGSTIEPIFATESVSSTNRPKGLKTEQRRVQKLPADKRRTPLNNFIGQRNDIGSIGANNNKPVSIKQRHMEMMSDSNSKRQQSSSATLPTSTSMDLISLLNISRVAIVALVALLNIITTNVYHYHLAIVISR